MLHRYHEVHADNSGHSIRISIHRLAPLPLNAPHVQLYAKCERSTSASFWSRRAGISRLTHLTGVGLWLARRLGKLNCSSAAPESYISLASFG
jgi:hypothetical protein